MEWHRIGGLFRIELVIATIMLCLGSIDTYYSILIWKNTSREWLNLLSNMVLFACAIYLFTTRNKNKIVAVGLCSVALGLNGILISLHTLWYDSSYLQIFVALVRIGLGVNLLYSGFRYLTGVSRNAANMRITSGALATIYGLIFIYMIHLGIFPGENPIAASEVMWIALMYGSFSYALCSDEIWSRTFLGRTSDDVHFIRASHGFAGGAMVDRSAALAIKKALDGDLPSRDDGPVTGEIVITVFRMRDHTQIVLQRWKGQDGLRLTLVGSINDTFFGGSDTVTDIVPDDGDLETCKAFRLYCESGRSLRLTIGRGADQ
jgi:hypothetical protein